MSSASYSPAYLGTLIGSLYVTFRLKKHPGFQNSRKERIRVQRAKSRGDNATSLSESEQP
jgi:hypothetical protein